MRTWPLVFVAAAACGSDKVHHLADGGGTADAPADSARDAARGDDAVLVDARRLDAMQIDAAPDAPPDANVAGSLNGLLWSLPCTGAHSSTSCATNPTATASTTVTGVAGTTYDFDVHLRGVIEQRTYATSCTDGQAVSGGDASNGDTFNVYELDVSAPPQRLFVNPGTSNIDHTFALDYTLAFRADAGATITLQASSIDSGEIFNHDGSGDPISIAGTAVAQPFDGQFIELDVDSVVPDPIQSTASVGAGSASFALQYAGAQQATVADVASLEPADVTLEAWFQATGVPAPDNLVLGKTFGGGTGDSYVIWFESGAFHSGANLTSPAGSTSLPYAPVDGQWHHIATTFDNTAARTTLYIDGAAVACSNTTGPIQYDRHPVLIGADIDNNSPNGFWQGFLDEVRVFSTVRSADQIWADMHAHQLGPTTGLVGEWTFDEGSGQTAADSSGTGNAAVLGGTTAVEANDPVWVVSTVPH